MFIFYIKLFLVVAYQQLKLNRAIWRKDYMIDPVDIQILNKRGLQSKKSIPNAVESGMQNENMSLLVNKYILCKKTIEILKIYKLLCEPGNKLKIRNTLLVHQVALDSNPTNYLAFNV